MGCTKAKGQLGPETQNKTKIRRNTEAKSKKGGAWLKQCVTDVTQPSRASHLMCYGRHIPLTGVTQQKLLVTDALPCVTAGAPYFSLFISVQQHKPKQKHTKSSQAFSRGKLIATKGRLLCTSTPIANSAGSQLSR